MTEQALSILVEAKKALEDAWAGFINLSSDMEPGPLKNQMRLHVLRTRRHLDIIDEALMGLGLPNE